MPYCANSECWRFAWGSPCEPCQGVYCHACTKNHECTETKQQSQGAASVQSGPKRVAFVLGNAGVGKGTQCARIVEHFGWAHLSAGDLLRAERASGSANAEMIEKICMEGKIVPSEITVGLILKAMEQTPAKGYLIDGFPRNEENKQVWEKMAGDRAKVEFCLFYDCPLDELERRLIARGRKDDEVDIIKKRFDTFTRESLPVVNWFREQGLLREIDGRQPVEVVWEQTKKCFE